MAFKLPNKPKIEVETISGMDLSDYKKYLTGIKKLFKSHPELKNELVSTGWLNIRDAGKGMLKSDSGIKFPIEDLPEELEDIKGEYGVGSIQLSDIIFYNSDVIKNVIHVVDNDWEEDIEAFSISIYSLLDKKMSFPLKSCVPVMGSKSWSSPKELSKGTADSLSQVLRSIYYEIIPPAAISKLHMVEDNPVLSFYDKQGTTDYGLTAILLKEFNIPIAEAYFICSENNDSQVSKVIAKKNKNNEYTLTIY